MSSSLHPKPEYFLKSFPRHDFPRYQWGVRPPNLPTKVWTTETSHRDGQQGGMPLTTQHSLSIYDLLCQFTGSSGAIRQAEFFVYHPDDRVAFQEAWDRYQSGAPIEPTTWIRATSKDVGLIKNLGVRETGLLASASDYHTFHKFKPGGRAPAARLYLEATHLVLEAGIRPRLHLEDATRAPLDFVLPLVEEVLKLAAPYGPNLKPKFRVCDTLGLGLPYENVALPRSIPKLIRALRQLGLQAEDLEFHPHNDTGLVVANCLAALRAGCGVINGACLGKGERTGNAPLEAVILHMIGMGFFEGNRPNFAALNDLVTVYEQINQPISPNYPLYGRDAYRTRAGIHADGLNKFWWMYAPFNTPKLLGRDLEVSITRDSGAAGLIFLVKQRLNLTLSKKSPQLLGLQKWIQREFESGRQTSLEWEELEPVARRYLDL